MKKNPTWAGPEGPSKLYEQVAQTLLAPNPVILPPLLQSMSMVSRGIPYGELPEKDKLKPGLYMSLHDILIPFESGGVHYSSTKG